MKRILLFFGVLFSGVLLVMAGNQSLVALSISDINTNATYDTAESSSVDGWIDRVYINNTIGTDAYTNSVMLIASNTYTHEERTIVPATPLGLNTNLSVYPRVLCVTPASVAITNLAVPIPLYDDVLVLKAALASTTNKSVRGYIYLKK